MPKAKRAADAARLRREVARSVDAPPSLVPYFEQLFAGMPSLGSSPRRLANTLKTAGVEHGARVLDLACGKGAIAVELAHRLNCSVTAVDACPAFLEEGRRRAASAGVADRVRFIESDVRVFAGATARSRRRWDVALMIGLLAIDEAAPMLRTLVRPRGIYAIDDVFRDDKLTYRRSEFLSIPTKAQCREIIEASGDRLIAADVTSPSRLRALNDSLYKRLAENARALRASTPSLARDLQAFLSNQRHANRLLGGQLRPAIWITQRT